MRRHHIYWLVFYCCCSASSCREFLTVDPVDELSRTEIFSSIRGADAAVIGLYNQLGSGNYYQYRFPIYADQVTNVRPSSEASQPDFDPFSGQKEQFLVTYGLSTSSSYPFSKMNTTYEKAYQVLYQANDVLESLPFLEDGTMERRASLRAEALAIRGLVHFDLVRLFAQAPGFSATGDHQGIALLTSVPGAFDTPPRNTVAEVYASIRADLEEAESLLDEDFSRRSNGPFWLTRTVIRGFLARVTSYQNDWSASLDWAQSCLNGNIRELTTGGSYAEQWREGNLTETLWQLDLQRYLSDDANSEVRISSPAIIIGEAQETPFLQVSQELIDLHPAEDLRRALYTVSDEGNILTGKWPFSPNTIANPVLLRLSEIYLLRAEAAAELGQTEVANTDYRRIRQRANPGLDIPDLNGAELITAIREERRLELAFEGHHFFDLGRWGADLRRENCAAFVRECELSYPHPRYVLPIPLRAIVRNPFLMQNPGY